MRPANSNCYIICSRTLSRIQDANFVLGTNLNEGITQFGVVVWYVQISPWAHRSWSGKMIKLPKLCVHSSKNRRLASHHHAWFFNFFLKQCTRYIEGVYIMFHGKGPRSYANHELILDLMCNFHNVSATSCWQRNFNNDSLLMPSCVYTMRLDM